jgi:hypothetical protein
LIICSLAFIIKVMAILFSGDFHANAAKELLTITKENLVLKLGEDNYNSIKYHVILGDGGFLWPGMEKIDTFNYKALACRKFPVLCVIGNHEPILGIENPEEVDIGIGNNVYKINNNPFVAYLKRGKIYFIEKYKFLVLGGALSIDKAWRVPGKSWWEKEYWTPKEEQEVFKLLNNENKFDYVLTHTGPKKINKIIFAEFSDTYSFKDKDKVALLNDKIDSIIKCKQWLCGHWHEDEYYYDNYKKRGYRYLYSKIGLLKDSEIKIY